MVCFVCHVEISQTMVPIAALLVSLESPWWVEVHQIGFITIQPTVEVVIEYWRWWKKLHQFDQVSKNGFLLSCCGLFPLQYWVYYCFEASCMWCWKLQKLQKLQNLDSSQPMIHTSTISLKMWIRKIYWTLTLSTATQSSEVWHILGWSGEIFFCKIFQFCVLVFKVWVSGNQQLC